MMSGHMILVPQASNQALVLSCCNNCPVSFSG